MFVFIFNIVLYFHKKVNHFLIILFYLWNLLRLHENAGSASLNRKYIIVRVVYKFMVTHIYIINKQKELCDIFFIARKLSYYFFLFNYLKYPHTEPLCATFNIFKRFLAGSYPKDAARSIHVLASSYILYDA